MIKGHCELCGYPMHSTTLMTLDDKRDVKVCPNCIIGLVLKQDIQPLWQADRKCVFCGSQMIAAKIHDFKHDGPSTRFEYDVCFNHIAPLVKKNLQPADVMKLRKAAGGDVFETHDDFYDEEGNALQPKG